MNHYFDLATILSYLIGTVLPIIVGLVTKVNTHPAVKGGVLLGLSAITGVLSQWLDAVNSNTPFLWQPVVLSALGAFVVAEVTHSAILKNTPLSNSGGTPFGQSPSQAYAITDSTASAPVDVTDITA